MKLKIILMVIIGILIYIIFFQILPGLNGKYYECNIFHEINSQKIHSKVLRKFIDSDNHNYKKINYLNDNGIEDTMIFPAELCDMYDFLNVGDSIIKKENSIYYKVKNKATGRDTSFKLDTMCKDSLK